MDAPVNRRRLRQVGDIGYNHHSTEPTKRHPSMSKVTLLAIDLAKDVFQIAGFTDKMKVEFNKLDIFCSGVCVKTCKASPINGNSVASKPSN